MLIIVLRTGALAGTLVLVGWVAVVAATWRGAVTAYRRLAHATKRDVDEHYPLLLAAGVSLSLTTLLCVRSGALQTAAEILVTWACATTLLRAWFDARVLPAPPRRRRALPPMDDAIDGSRGYL
jgi:hypothetical protein